MKIMTPADKLNDIESVRGLANCTIRRKKIITPPMQVERPPAILKPNARPTLPPDCSILIQTQNTTQTQNIKIWSFYRTANET